MTMAGVSRQLLRRLIVKEVVDNALDEIDNVHGDPGSVTVAADGPDMYIVEDGGSGIDQDSAKLCDWFSFDREMVTGKSLRKPSRGVLGNGLRVLASAVVLSESTITVESHGKRTTLKPRRIGATEVVSQVSGPRQVGTRITFTLGAIIPRDNDDLVDAEAAISLARAAGPAYARPPSPHWLDLDYLTEICAYIEPDDMTVRKWVEGLDGCSGPAAGHISAPFGKGRTLHSLNEAEIAELLLRMQAKARVVKPKDLGKIGKGVFGVKYDGYKYAETWLEGSGKDDPASIPVLIEAWASVTSRQRGEARLTVFCNRTRPVKGMSASRGLKGIQLTGAGFEYWHNAVVEVPGGDCDLILAVTAPYISITSHGKAPDLHQFQAEIVEALRKAFNQSRHEVQADPKQPKQPKAEPPPKKPKPGPYRPSGPLATFHISEAAKRGMSPRDLLVLGNDPFDEKRSIRRNAQWFADLFEHFVPEGRKVHVRGVYYICVSAGNVLKPNGTLFVGSHSNYVFITTAAKYARYLGLVPFDRIRDERSAEPIYRDFDKDHADASGDPVRRRLLVSVGREPDKRGPLALPDLDLLLPALSIAAPPKPRQKYRIVFIGEKTSLYDVLEPIAREVYAELMLGTGEISEPRVYDMCKEAAADGRALIILYFCDFDPSGWQMPVSVARKVQAQIRREFHDLDARVIRVALTLEQVEKYNLPDSPIKEGDKRKGDWFQKWGREQVEIDALAVLRPEVLEQIARDAVAPFFDFTYERRYAKATEMPPQRKTWFTSQPAYKKAAENMRQAYAEAVEAIDSLDAAQAEALDVMGRIVQTKAPALPKMIVKPNMKKEPEECVFNSKDDYVDATLKLKEIKNLAPDDEDEDD
jgi:hypothetical protein